MFGRLTSMVRSWARLIGGVASDAVPNPINTQIRNALRIRPMVQAIATCGQHYWRNIPITLNDLGPMHYEKAPHFGRSRPDEAPPPLCCAVQGFAPLRRRWRVTAVVCAVGKNHRRA